MTWQYFILTRETSSTLRSLAPGYGRIGVVLGVRMGTCVICSKLCGNVNILSAILPLYQWYAPRSLVKCFKLMFHSEEYTRGDSNGQVQLKVKALFYHILEKSRGYHVIIKISLKEKPGRSYFYLYFLRKKL